MNLGKTTNTILLLTACAIISLAGWYFLMQSNPAFRINTNRTAVVKEMKALQRLETASFTIEKIIDGGTTEQNPIKQFLFGDRLLLIAHGEVIAGFDLSKISDNDITIKGDAITVQLPAAEIFTTALDNKQTRVYDRRRGILNMGEDNLESEIRQAAESSIRQAACDSGILRQASENGQKHFKAFFASLGFSKVSIEVPSTSCK